MLDGKQRLETILHFIGRIKIEGEGDWTIKIRKNPEELLSISYDDLLSVRFNKQNNNIADKFWSYEIPVIEYEGELRDFFDNPVPAMDVFVRINSTGSPLKKNEIRHASNAAPFFKLGEELEKAFKKRFIEIWKIFSDNELRRYAFHEYLLELCTAIYFQHYTDKRKKLDELIYNHTWKESELLKIKKRFGEVITWLRSIFSDASFSHTRFRNKSDFYSLFIVLNDFIEKKYVAKDAKSNRILGNSLLEYSKTAQEISSILKSYDIDKSWKGVDREVLTYVIATRQSTDSLKSRQIRNDFLQKLLKGFIVKTKDSKRIFDENTKGILWTRLLQRYKVPKCPNPMKNVNCKKILTYYDAQVDHLHPWTKGGPTTLKNAQLICSSCNRSKSAKM